jgi:uncharacterized protein (DUF58 family)
MALTIEVGNRRRSLLLRTLAPVSAWLAADGPTAGVLSAVPGRRGVMGSVAVEVRCGAPLGLVWWKRRLDVPLQRPVDVAPAPVEVAIPREIHAGAAGGDPQRWARSGHDIVRGLREYSPGDPPRLVHWAASARRGDLLVKELEDHDRPRVAIVVDLRGPEDAAEEAAARAAGLAAAVLRAGLPLMLLTAERSGGMAGPVMSPLDAGRRLARAVAAAPAEGPVPPGTAVVRISTR